MGYDIEQIVLTLSVSRHNDERDVADQEAADDLRTDIQNIIHDEPDYRRIVIDTSGLG